MDNTLSSGSETFPALVTTPSDALGGDGSDQDNDSRDQHSAAHDNTPQGSDGSSRPASYAAAVQRGGQQDRKANVAPPSNIAGNWTPRERHILLGTLAQDWATSTAPTDTPEQAILRQVAMAPSKVHMDVALRERTVQETCALLQYLDRTLELPHPPTFLKATLPILQRAMVEQFHERHCEVMLTADNPPRAKLRRSMTHNTLLAQLHAANADTVAGRGLLIRLLEDVKRLQFDGLHTLKFVFNSERVARRYTGLALRLNGTCIELEDTTEDASKTTYRPARLRRQYAVRAYNVDTLGLVVLLAALGQLDGVEVIDAERSRAESSEIIDNGYFQLRFSTEQCPPMLRGVTKLVIHNHSVTLHHHVIYQRLPCARCCAPYHTTGFCKAKPGQLIKTQAKFRRTYKGEVSEYEVGTITQYRHTDGDSLNLFLDTLHRDLTGTAGTIQADSTTRRTAELVTESRLQAMPHAAPLEVAAQTSEAVASTTTGDGKTEVVGKQGIRSQSVSAEQAISTPTTATARTRKADTAGSKPTRSARPLGGGSKSQSKTGKQKAGQSKGIAYTPTSTAKGKTSAYVKFKQTHALGRFAVLAEKEEDADAGSLDDAEYDDAPYAYPPPMDMIPRTVPVQTTAVDNVARAGQPYADPQGAGLQPGGEVDEDMLSEETVLSSYVGSSAPSCTQSPATTPGSEFPYSLQSGGDDISTTMDGGSTPPQGEREVAMGSGVENQVTAQVAEPSLSQDGFSAGPTLAAPGMPQQLPTFLIPFQGFLTKVPANGQCAYAALYATMTSTTETNLKFTADVVKGVNIMKRSVYTLMMANLANDVDCKVVDPCRELRRLYPTQPAPADSAVATAALYTHYTQERSRTVNTQIPAAFWAGPEVLRAMAQYLREPLFVLDVDQHNDTHVQRYYYRDYTLPNGDIHETGCGGAMDDATAKEMLAHYTRLHVLPVLIVLKRNEGHFYGVHHGDIAIKWHAEGDLDFTRTNCPSHPWYDEVKAHIAYSQGLLAQVDYLNDDDATNKILIGAMERRARLDVVHDRLNMDKLDRDPYDIAILESGLAAEEREDSKPCRLGKLRRTPGSCSC
ncbi:hypothetical protein PR003_g20705 [Phytophthora rubi]|uniref:OTU domain-containing protein n=1 Tax=Phytophthora rubi TaxID=129364 RepID=A0A6A4DNF6_9STRA|nr:hypothetical protein PR003_g20705 [Phytophthora rubi]